MHYILNFNNNNNNNNNLLNSFTTAEWILLKNFSLIGEQRILYVDRGIISGVMYGGRGIIRGVMYVGIEVL